MSTPVLVGGGSVGGLFAGVVARAAGHTPVVIDVAGGPGFVAGDITDPDPGLRRLLSEARYVVLAVPERVALDALKPLGELLRPGAVLAQTLSVQSRFAEAAAALDARVEAVGLNPMFAPSLSPAGRPVAAVILRDGPGVGRLLDAVGQLGARVLRVGAEEHDRITAATQALTHACLLAFGHALADLGLPADVLAGLAPPPHGTLLSLLARVCGGTPEVYHDVQAGNPHAATARAALAAGVRAVDEAAARPGAFTALMRRAERALGGQAAGLRTRCVRIFEEMR